MSRFWSSLLKVFNSVPSQTCTPVMYAVPVHYVLNIKLSSPFTRPSYDITCLRSKLSILCWPNPCLFLTVNFHLLLLAHSLHNITGIHPLSSNGSGDTTYQSTSLIFTYEPRTLHHIPSLGHTVHNVTHQVSVRCLSLRA